jgi:hypothetical protein
MEEFETQLKRNGLSDPLQLVPLLEEISTDEHLPLIARNHALRLLKKNQQEIGFFPTGNSPLRYALWSAVNSLQKSSTRFSAQNRSSSPFNSCEIKATCPPCFGATSRM